jgi:hypothetical protein
VEAGLPDLDCAGDAVEALAEGKVTISPGNHLFVWDRLQLLLFDDRVPDGPLVRHIGDEGERNRIRDLHAKHLRDARPHMLPSKSVAVSKVEELVLRSWGVSRPNGSAS